MVPLVRTAALALCAALTVLASPASAQWKRAESPNFIVYSRGDEGALRRYVRNLEIYDHLLRLRMGISGDDQARRKLPIYLVSGASGLAQISPGLGQSVAGVYFPAGEDIFAAAISDVEQDTLLHEYFHHFSFQVGSTSSFPGWLIEGLAEYYATAEITPESVRIGGYHEDRVYMLFNANWLPLDELLSKRFGEIRREAWRDTYYPVAWLLTHWFMSDESRRQQLGAYIEDLRAGADSVEAIQRATGLTLVELRRELGSYRRLPMITYRSDFPQPEITVTRLPRSADDLLLIGQRLKVGVEEDKRDETAVLVRRLATRHPDDPFALLQLGHAELHFGDPDAGEAVLLRLLDQEPGNVEALQLMATRHEQLAADNPDDAIRHLSQARRFLARAHQADPHQYYTLELLARTRQLAPDYPTANDLLTWDQAFHLAPQLPSIRIGYAEALLEARETDTAIALLTPLANAPHGGGATAAAAALIAHARGDAPSAPAGSGDSDSTGPAEPADGAGPETRTPR